MQNDDTSIDPGRHDWLAALLLRRPEGFLSRFAAGAARWRMLSRNSRRRAGRRLAATAAGAALILAMAGSPLLVPSVRAATITVDETTCTLVDAIKSANTDAAVGGCVSGDPGLDTIDLQTDVTLTAAAGDYYGDTGLPLVTSEIVIEGNGFTIERDGTADDFRILAINADGDLKLNDVTISGGSAGFFDDGGGFYLHFGALSINNSTISDNDGGDGGGGANNGGTLTITDSIFSGNYARSDNGGGLFQRQSEDQDNLVVNTTITNSLFDANEAANDGGGIFVDVGQMTIIDTTITKGKAEDGPGVVIDEAEATVTIVGSTITDNGYTNTGGGVLVGEGVVDIVNSTISNNYAFGTGGGINNFAGQVSLTNVTITGNGSKFGGGGIAQYYSDDAKMTISRSIVTGNPAPGGEIYAPMGEITAGDYNVFSHAGQTSAAAFAGFTPGATDVNASSDAANIALADILDTTLADNGGPTQTHNLVDDSPAVDLAPDGDCTADPTGGVDQRGFFRPFDVVGQGNDAPSPNTCDAGAVEFGASDVVIFMSTRTTGTTEDGLDFGPEDILKWDGDHWSLRFDGSAAGLTPNGKAKHNINAFYVDPNGPFTLMSFAQNSRTVPGVFGKVDGMDLVVWDGSQFILVFDGQDVGLTNKTQEKIDAVHLLPGSASPVGDSCQDYLLISTQGPGRVSNPGEPAIKFGGEDVLGFCVTSNGDNTDGLWTLVLDGSAEGMPRNSTDSISVSEDGQVLYLTTRSTFAVDSAVGGHSMVYRYDFGTGEFSGPFFSAPAEGLTEKVDGLQVEGDLP